MLTNFTNALMDLKRRSSLQGRPVSRNESAGIAEGFANTASERLSRKKQLQIQEKELRFRQSQSLVEMKERDEARQREARGSMGAAGAAGGYMVGSAVGASMAAGASSAALAGGATAAGAAAAGASAGAWAGPIGAGVGLAVGVGLNLLGVDIGSWLCTETGKHVGLDKHDKKTLKLFREWAKKARPNFLKFYLRIGPELTKSIEGLSDVEEFYKNLKVSMIKPVISLVSQGKQEEAGDLYIKHTKVLIGFYTPRHSAEAEVADRLDDIKEAA